MDVEILTMAAAWATLGVAVVAAYLAYRSGQVLEDTQDIIHELGIITSIKAGIEHGPALMAGIKVAEKLQEGYDEGTIVDEDLNDMADEIIKETFSKAS